MKEVRDGVVCWDCAVTIVMLWMRVCMIFYSCAHLSKLPAPPPSCANLDPRQSDPRGKGTIARKFIKKGTRFYDPTVRYYATPPPQHLEPNYYIAVPDAGYFELARGEGLKNIEKLLLLLLLLPITTTN